MHLNDVFVVGEKYRALAESGIKLSELKNHPLIVMEKNTVSRKTLDNFCQSLGVKLSPSIEVGSWELMKRLVASGMGVGVIPREYIRRQVEEGSLFEVKTDVALPVRSIGMVLSKNAPVSYALHCFIEGLEKRG